MQTSYQSWKENPNVQRTATNAEGYASALSALAAAHAPTPSPLTGKSIRHDAEHSPQSPQFETALSKWNSDF
jgi:hypothetical protein